MPDRRSTVRVLAALVVGIAVLLALLVLRSDRTQPAPTVVAPVTQLEPRAPVDVTELDAPERTALVVETPPAVQAEPPAPRVRIEDKPGRLPPRDWQEFAPRVETPEGVLEVLVLDGGTPVAGVPVTIFDASSTHFPDRFEDVQDPLRRRTTDTNGIAQFDLLAEVRYWVRAWPEPTWFLEGESEHWSGAKRRRLVLALGTGVVHGTVYDSGGAPWAGAGLMAICSVQGAHSSTRRTRADSEGRFRFERLGPGFILLMQNVTDARDLRLRRNRARFVLHAGETLQVDLGSAHPFATWTGVVRASSGEVLALPAQIQFDELDHGNEFVTTADESGRFRIELPRGAWVARSVAHYPSVELGRFEVDADVIERDLVVPGIVVQLELSAEPRMVTRFYLESTEPPMATVNFNEIGGTRIAVVTTPQSFRLRASQPGLLSGAPPEGLDVDLRGRSGLVRLDVAIVPQ